MARISTLLLATGNPKKLAELREILASAQVRVLAPADIGYRPEVEETGATFEENAILKAAAGVARTGYCTIADDSGIEARALGGRPGVYSARYAGPDCDDAANNRKLVEELAGSSDRAVAYRCVIALARPHALPLTWSGVFAGEHIPEPRGAGGFGYDPYVLIPELGRTVAELDAAQKHARSHRGQALRQFLAWMQSGGSAG